MTAPSMMQGGAPTATRSLYRSRFNREIAGVCGGIAAYIGADASAIRFLTVLVAIVTGVIPTLVLYVIGAVLIPEEPLSEALPMASPGDAPQWATPASRRQRHLFVGVLLMAIGLVALANQTLHPDWNLLWPVVLIILGGALLVAAPRR
jgi:phage shock protein C